MHFVCHENSSLFSCSHSCAANLARRIIFFEAKQLQIKTFSCRYKDKNRKIKCVRRLNVNSSFYSGQGVTFVCQANCSLCSCSHSCAANLAKPIIFFETKRLQIKSFSCHYKDVNRRLECVRRLNV